MNASRVALPLRIMVVDDSVLARKAVTDALSSIPEVVVAASAPNGRIALQKMGSVYPDICIVDLEMPEMDGIELIGHLRESYPRVRIIVHTANGSMAQRLTAQALMSGASDILLKPNLPGVPFEQQILAIREALLPKVLQFLPPETSSVPIGRGPRRVVAKPKALIIGISTGGPEALNYLLARLPANFPLPILVVQHMPPGFTHAFAERLDQISPLSVKEAAEGDEVLPGHVLIAPGGIHLSLREADGRVLATLTSKPEDTFCRPAADVLFQAADAIWKGELLVLVMTGMGSDGLHGARICKSHGARVLVQDEASSVVWGMPGSIAKEGLADGIFSLEELPACLIDVSTSRSSHGTGAS